MLIDINCDLGEGMGNDNQIMPYISSCNIACGGHYGDKSSIIKTIKSAQKHKVKIGAHPSFPDQVNFGRKILTISKHDLHDSLCQQIYLFIDCCEALNHKMHHVKLHGALYNLAAKDSQTAEIVIDALNKCCKGTALYAPYKSELARLAQADYKVIYEAFADRRYHNNLTLVSRDRDDAVITEANSAWKQVSSVIENGLIETVEGDSVVLKAGTFCVHGDQSHAIELVQYIASKLSQHSML